MMARIEQSETGTTVVYEKDRCIHEYFDCSCDTAEHTLRMTYFLDDFGNMEEDEIYAEIHLSKYGFWRRVWKALKYVFGYKCRYGHWDCWILKRTDAERLKALIERYLGSGLTRMDNDG